MQTHEVPDKQWIPFLNDLSKRHQGEPVTVELIGRDIGDQSEAKDQSLLGITVDPPTGSCKIEVMSGGSDSLIAHEISHPIHVRLAQLDNGADAALEIESDSGPSTLVRFLTSEQAGHA
ncbi:MAG TPA: DUF5335 family protein [Tepidisphaeraceae bacterium]|jgi:hypothetical protein|nr:DUF5335 family protein [Tepidisphaeraceae bacterium]